MIELQAILITVVRGSYTTNRQLSLRSRDRSHTLGQSGTKENERRIQYDDHHRRPRSARFVGYRHCIPHTIYRAPHFACTVASAIAAACKPDRGEEASRDSQKCSRLHPQGALAQPGNLSSRASSPQDPLPGAAASRPPVATQVPTPGAAAASQGVDTKNDTRDDDQTARQIGVDSQGRQRLCRRSRDRRHGLCWSGATCRSL